jgi:hypothetical protein
MTHTGSNTDGSNVVYAGTQDFAGATVRFGKPHRKRAR